MSNEILNKCVFRFVLKQSRVLDLRIDNGSAFQILRPAHTRRQVAATGLCDKLLRVYYLQNNSLRYDTCSVHTQKSRMRGNVN